MTAGTTPGRVISGRALHRFTLRQFDPRWLRPDGRGLLPGAESIRAPRPLGGNIALAEGNVHILNCMMGAGFALSPTTAFMGVATLSGPTVRSETGFAGHDASYKYVPMAADYPKIVVVDDESYIAFLGYFTNGEAEFDWRSASVCLNSGGTKPEGDGANADSGPDFINIGLCAFADDNLPGVKPANALWELSSLFSIL
jgi:hypothetical protein